MSGQIPTIGRIVKYTISEQDAANINALSGFEHNNANKAYAGQIFPMMIVATWGNYPGALVNGQVFVDGNFTIWVTSINEGVGYRSYSWPERV